MADLTFTLRYVEDGHPIAESYASTIGALGRIGALVGNGIGHQFAIYLGEHLLMDQGEIFESLKITNH